MMCEHDALGLSGRSRSINYRRDLIRGHLRRAKPVFGDGLIAGCGSKRLVAKDLLAEIRGPRGTNNLLHRGEPAATFEQPPRLHLSGNEDNFRAGMVQYVNDPVR